MAAYIDRDYELKSFEIGQFYKLALELISYIGSDMANCDFRIGYTVDDIRITDEIDIHQLAEITELRDNFDSLTFDISREAIRFYVCCENIKVLYFLSYGLEKAKDIILLIESILQLKRIEQI